MVVGCAWRRPAKGLARWARQVLGGHCRRCRMPRGSACLDRGRTLQLLAWQRVQALGMGGMGVRWRERGRMGRQPIILEQLPPSLESTQLLLLLLLL
eukprot:CAMPEP_0202360616 /NCGR_PEP_ID=MMETSP1126-20121109/13489_1 /ASSEMBLY_ACC=CAM_ASM_000457 /TAXON_ID=3047 /ORGANISM="Dunaliella tertiolecta, Strain CCMP1320" /LENGTH=96 /DNA_ID=CAMNT_0048954367 /DNA_START=352 /DNA_END=638 /DNA_ORIENTATION=+